jgi:hypothetical protein
MTPSSTRRAQAVITSAVPLAELRVDAHMQSSRQDHLDLVTTKEAAAVLGISTRYVCERAAETAEICELAELDPWESSWKGTLAALVRPLLATAARREVNLEIAPGDEPG